MKLLKPLFVVSLLWLVCSAVFAQSNTPNELNLTLGEQWVRFAPTRSFQEMRLEVVNREGEIVFTYLTSEAEFDWNLRAGNGEPLAAGLYSYVLTLKFSEERTRQHRGNLIIERDHQQVWLTAQDGATVSGASLNAVRSGGRSLAGFRTAADEQGKRKVEGREIVDEKGNPLIEADKPGAHKIASILATGNQLAKFAADGVTLIDSAVTETGGNVGVGTTSPNAKFSVNANTGIPPATPGIVGYFANANEANTFITADSYGNGPWHSDFLFRRARGTMATPLAILADDIVGQIQMRGYGTTGFATTARAGIRLSAAQNWTDTAQGAYLAFMTNPNNSAAINVERMRITDDGSVGIGTTTPEAKLELDFENTGASPPRNLFVTGHSVDPVIAGRFSRGTHAAPTAALANDDLLFLGGRGHTGTAFVAASKGAVRIRASEAWSSTANGTYITLETTTNGTTTVTERMRIDHDGQVGIGTTAPTALLSVNGTANKSGGGSWAVFSDERLKDIKGRYTKGWQALRKLQPIRFEYKADNALGLKNPGETIGFSAQAVAEAIPEAVSMTPQGYLQLNQDPILWTMLNTVKEQQAQIQQLLKNNRQTQRINQALRTRVQRLERQTKPNHQSK